MCACARVRACVRACASVRASVGVHVCACVCMSAYALACMRACVRACVRACERVCVRGRNVCMHARSHARTHTHRHTRTLRSALFTILILHCYVLPCWLIDMHAFYSHTATFYHTLLCKSFKINTCLLNVTKLLGMQDTLQRKVRNGRAILVTSVVHEGEVSLHSPLMKL